jgi:hypothetical protein
MLDSFIIEELRRREERERNRARQERPRLELPVDDRHPPREPAKSDDDEDKPKRGVVVIDI